MLGLTFVADDGVALVFDLAGTMLRIAHVDTFTAQPFTVLGWRVEDVARTVLALEQRGVTFERYSGLDQDGLGVWLSPAGARVAWFKDPDGNVLALSQLAL